MNPGLESEHACRDAAGTGLASTQASPTGLLCAESLQRGKPQAPHGTSLGSLEMARVPEQTPSGRGHHLAFQKKQVCRGHRQARTGPSSRLPPALSPQDPRAPLSGPQLAQPPLSSKVQKTAPLPREGRQPELLALLPADWALTLGTSVSLSLPVHDPRAHTS